MIQEMINNRNHEIFVTCPHCGQDFDLRRDWPTCPHCGHNYEEKPNK